MIITYETTELIKIHLQEYVQVSRRTERVQGGTYPRLRNHEEMGPVVFIHLFTVTAQIPKTVHAVEPLSLDSLLTKITTDPEL